VPFTQRLLTAMEPWLNDSLSAYLIAIGAMWQPIDDIIEDVGVDGDPDYRPGYGVLYDIDACPTADLPYLGQIVGVEVPTGADDPTSRQVIRAEAGRSRGTVAAIESAAKRWLAGSQNVVLLERQDINGTPDAYELVIHVQDDEVIDADALRAAIEAVKPAGIQINNVVNVNNGWQIDQATGHINDDDFVTIDQAFFTRP
jgi:hypothetical protein